MGQQTCGCCQCAVGRVGEAQCWKDNSPHTPSEGWNSSNCPLLFAAESLSQQMFGLEAWMCLRCPWSLITTCPTTENSTYTGKPGVHIRECSWATLPHSGSTLSFLPPPQNWPLRQIWAKRCSYQLCEERRHPHPARHRAVLLHPDRRDAHERWVWACPGEAAAALLCWGAGALQLEEGTEASFCHVPHSQLHPLFSP